jgi:hypothetical protein
MSDDLQKQIARERIVGYEQRQRDLAIQAREREIQRREADLQRREAELRQRQDREREQRRQRQASYNNGCWENIK